MSRYRFVSSAAAATLLLLGLATCREDEPTGVGDTPERAAAPGPALAFEEVGTPAIMAGAGDIARCSGTGDEATAQLLDVTPGTVFTLGDNVYENATATEFASCYNPSWGRHKARTRPAAGNQDYNNPGAAAYFGYFGAAAGTAGQGYYSYDVGTWHVIVLNSMVARTPSSAQVQWLRGDLAAHTHLCTLAYFHHPLYSSVGGSGSGGEVWTSVRTFWDTLYAAGTDLILGAHRHDYERLAPMRPDGTVDETFGMRQIIVGTGGRGGSSMSNVYPTSVVRDGNTFGVLKLYLYEGSYAWRFMPVAGKTFSDSGSAVCHPKPGSTGATISPTLSTVTASPGSVTAGGSSTISVTARDENGAAVSGATVALTVSGSGTTLTQPSDPTGVNGVATGTLQATLIGSKTVSAKIDGVAIAQTAAVDVTAGAPSPSQSSVSASPGSIQAGTEATTITVTVRDGFGNPVSGAAVALSATGGGNILTQPSAPTNGSGTATGTLASTVAEMKTVSATAAGVAVSQTASVTVLAGGATIAHSLLTSGTDPTNAKVFVTAPVAPAPNTLVTVAVLGHRTPSATTSPTLAGGGMAAWTEVASVTFDAVDAPLKRLTVFRATSPAPGSGPITITFPQNVSNAQWIVSQWSGVDESGADGAGAIVQTATSRADLVSGLGVALAPFASAGDAAYGIVGTNGNGLIVAPGLGFTEIAEHSSGEAARAVLEAEWAGGDETIQANWSGLLNAGMVGIELRAAGGP